MVQEENKNVTPFKFHYVTPVAAPLFLSRSKRRDCRCYETNVQARQDGIFYKSSYNIAKSSSIGPCASSLFCSAVAARATPTATASLTSWPSLC
jgi:hypothetical protein